MTQAPSCTLHEALACHGAGRLEEAEFMYGAVLEREPRNPDAWHLLGRLALARGDFRSAAARVLQAIRFRPMLPAYPTSLAEILAAHNRHTDALRCCRQALRLAPGYVPALVSMGNILQSQEHYSEACAWYWRAIRLNPECAEAFSNLGNALHAADEHEQAVACYREACNLRPRNAVNAVNLSAGLLQLARYVEAEQWARCAVGLEPGMAEALSNLSLALAGQERWVEAEALARRAVERAPHIARLHLNLGNLLLHQSRFAEAEGELRCALNIQPDYPQAANNLAVALHQQDREEEAAALCQCLSSALPQSGEVWANFGIVRQAQGRNREAIACFDEALRRRPDDARAHVCRSLAMLAEGYYAAGFAEYEWRWKLLPALPRAAALPAWNGSPPAGKTILLWAEQGLGDTLQFIRFATLVAALGARVIVECPECLAGLVGSVEGVSRVIRPSDCMPPCDLQVPLLSLPRLLGTTLETLPSATPYLRTGPAPAARDRQSAPARKLRVGLVWAGSPGHVSDRLRSIALRRMSVLGEVPDVEWHNLQVEERPGEETSGEPAWLRCSPERPRNAGALAAAMCGLHLVITVDSMPAHLAGALGLPAWTLLSFAPDWRWGTSGSSSPWYPTMRLFRQDRPGDWEGVLKKVCEELRRKVQAFQAADDEE